MLGLEKLEKFKTGDNLAALFRENLDRLEMVPVWNNSKELLHLWLKFSGDAIASAKFIHEMELAKRTDGGVLALEVGPAATLDPISLLSLLNLPANSGAYPLVVSSDDTSGPPYSAAIRANRAMNGVIVSTDSNATKLDAHFDTIRMVAPVPCRIMGLGSSLIERLKTGGTTPGSNPLQGIFTLVCDPHSHSGNTIPERAFRQAEAQRTNICALAMSSAQRGIPFRQFEPTIMELQSGVYTAINAPLSDLIGTVASGWIVPHNPSQQSFIVPTYLMG